MENYELDFTFLPHFKQALNLLKAFHRILPDELRVVGLNGRTARTHWVIFFGSYVAELALRSELSLGQLRQVVGDQEDELNVLIRTTNHQERRLAVVEAAVSEP